MQKNNIFFNLILGVILLSSCPNVIVPNTHQIDTVDSKTYLFVYGEHYQALSPEEPTEILDKSIASISITPEIGFQFKMWTVGLGENVEITDPYSSTTTVKCNKGFNVIIAICEEATSEVSIQKTGNGTIIPGNLIISKKGVPTWITFIPDDYYIFTGWSIVEGDVLFEDSDSPTTTITCFSDNIVINANLSYKNLESHEDDYLPPEPYNQNPIADGYYYPNPAYIKLIDVIENYSVIFNHELSYHISPSNKIIRYEWIFDVGPTDITQIGSKFQSVSWPSMPGYTSDGRGWWGNNIFASPRSTYIVPGVYTAALHVLDDTNPVKHSYKIFNGIQVNAPNNSSPTNVTRGPYIIKQGNDLFLEGEVEDIDLAWDNNESLSSRWILPLDGYSEQTISEREKSITLLPCESGIISWSDLEAQLGDRLNTLYRTITIGLETIDSKGEAFFSITKLVVIK